MSRISMISSAVECILKYVYDELNKYVDIDYLLWVVWLLYPITVTFFILPLVLLFCLYSCSIFCHLYRLRYNLIHAVQEGDFWCKARNIISIFWDAHGNVWHGYEVFGFEKIPDSGPALLVYYHGAVPVDLYYLYAKIYIHKKRSMHCIADRFLFRIPGFSLLCEVLYMIQGSVSNCVKVLDNGNLLAIAPGGVREALFSDEYYHLEWGARLGFANVALEARVPIIPIFTQNCREAFRAIQIGKSFFKKIYEKTRWPLCPVYGGFPVKLRTFIGDPITFDSTMSPEQLKIKVQNSIKELIEKHQRIPGTIFNALMERFYTPDHIKYS